jgi:hypothetical protein
MKVTPTPDGKIVIQPETDFEENFLINIGCVLSGILHIDHDVKKTTLTIKKRIPDNE